MNITEIRYNPVNSNEIQSFNKIIKPTETSRKPIDSKDISINNPAWQKDILLSALDSLENNIQLDNIHPLDRQSSAPIETFGEAVLELNFLLKSFNNDEAMKAQANIQPADILSLFIAEPAN